MDHLQYYDQLAIDARYAAQRILPSVLAAAHPRSLIDIGCGPGSWSREARALGVERVVGVDGPWAEQYADENYTFVRRDLRQPVSIDETFDVAICLEVAQFLPLERVDSFVQELCELAPNILFSSRIPHQWDYSTSNAQWPSWWADRFAVHGRTPLDIVRPAVWVDRKIPEYYRQNTLLYVSEAVSDTPPASRMLDVVHPEMWEAAHTLTVRERCRIAAGIPKAVTTSVARRVRARRAS